MSAPGIDLSMSFQALEGTREPYGKAESHITNIVINGVDSMSGLCLFNGSFSTPSYVSEDGTVKLQKLFIVVSIFLSAPAFALPDDVKQLTQGVKSVAKPGIPGPLVVFGAQAFPVIAARSGELHYPVVAGGRFGKGRFLAWGHGGYFGSLKHEGTATLFSNARSWLVPKKGQLKIATLASNGLSKFYRGKGHKIIVLKGSGWAQSLDSVDLFLCSPNNHLTSKDIKSIHAYVTGGGALIVSQLGWGWQQLNPKKSLVLDHPGNRLMRKLGIAWGSGYLDKIFPKVQPSLDLLNAGVAIKQLSHLNKLKPKEQRQVAGLIAHATRNLPQEGHPFMASLRDALRNRSPSWPPSSKHPLRTSDVLGRLALTLRSQESLTKPPEKIRPFPGAEIFPGIVSKDVKRVSQTVAIRRDRGAWISTGLYLNAGEVMIVRFPKEATEAGLTLRVGAHSDRLWGKASWRRHPEISRRFAVKKRVMRVATSHGGLIYVETPLKKGAQPFKVKFENVSLAPRYVLGRTSDKDWDKIRRYEAPWGELETSKIILTVPSRVLRDLVDPKQLMTLWDRVLDCYEELGTRPLPTRPERMVTDEQISAGYMHSGYPIMTHLDAAKRMVTTASILGRPKLEIWGLWHELGHNHQKRAWTFQGTTEVTCNLFTLYVLDRISGVSPEKHPRYPGMRASGRKHRAAGAPFSQWKRKPFLALQMYVELQQEFGWELFKKVFALYRDLPRKDQPKSDLERRDKWLELVSQVSGKNLGPFFQAWGVPVSKAALAKVKHLPGWLPKDWKKP